MSSWRDHVSNDTKIMIDKLCELNEDQKKLDKQQTLFFFIFLGAAILLFIYAIVYILVLADTTLLKSVLAFFKSIIHIVLILITIALFFVQLFFQSRHFSAWEHFENLRHEVIDHLKSPWYKNEHTEMRDKISQEMESEGINIRFKSIA